MRSRLVPVETLLRVVLVAMPRLIVVGVEASVLVEAEEDTREGTSGSSMEVLSDFAACIGRRFG